jgi:phage shock protein C
MTNTPRVREPGDMNDIHSNDHADRPPAPPQPAQPVQPQQGFPHPQPSQGPPPPPPVPPTAPPVQAWPSGTVQDDVWGVRPPALGPQGTSSPSQQGYGQQPYGQPGHGQQGHPGATAAGGSSNLDRGLSALQKSPLRRDTADGIIGGVAAGIAKRMNVSPAAVRIAAVALALFFGSGIAAYLIAWALLPDESGRTHVEQGVKGGSTNSLIILALGGLAALGMVASVLDGLGWLVPIAVTAGIVYYVVNAGKKKGDGATG